ncbi:MAG: hypothetical protein F6J93_03555 [Oscillatoria sp. SIO1A7]|nr:hypothetical protein [Oscillatoria sp. SIO1A7]
MQWPKTVIKIVAIAFALAFLKDLTLTIAFFAELPDLFALAGLFAIELLVCLAICETKYLHRYQKAAYFFLIASIIAI